MRGMRRQDCRVDAAPSWAGLDAVLEGGIEMLHGTAVVERESDWLEFKQIVWLVTVFSLLIWSFAFVGLAHAGDVTLAWDPNTEPEIAGYKLYFGKTSRNYLESVDIGNATRYTLMNLTDGVTYYFAVTAYDIYGHESDYSAELVHGVNNQSPVASAGPDQTVPEGEMATLNGANSHDPDGTIVSYSWVQTAGTKVVIMDPRAAVTTFITPYVGTTGETISFTLMVTDRCGVQAFDGCTITVVTKTLSNLPPVAAAGADKTVSEWTSVLLDGSRSSDPDDGIASYAWRQIAGPSVRLVDADWAQPTFVAPNVGPHGASLTFELTVTDSGGLQAKDSCIVNVINANLPPVANAGQNQTVSAWTTVRLNGSASTDPDDGIASFKWTQTAGTPVTLSDPSAVQPTFKAPRVRNGTLLKFKLTVTDRSGLTSSDSCKVTLKW